MPTPTQRQRLEEPFPHAMEQFVTKGNARLTYIPVAEVINRLNDVLGTGGWSWHTESVWRDETDPEWVIARGTMTATVDGETSSKDGSGGVKVKRTKTTDEIVDLGDEFKGAESDALKKAAQRFGVAAYLARKDEAIRYEAPTPVRDPVAEGYDSADSATELIATLKARIQALPSDDRQEVRAYTERIGCIWPPTRDEYDLIVAFLAAPTPQDGPPVPTPAPDRPVPATPPPAADPVPVEPEPNPESAPAPVGGPTKEAVMSMTVRELAAWCRTHHLAVNGTKPELQRRVLEAAGLVESQTPVEQTMFDPSGSAPAGEEGAAAAPEEMINSLAGDVAKLRNADARAYAEYRRKARLPGALADMTLDQALGLADFLDSLTGVGERS